MRPTNWHERTVQHRFSSCYSLGKKRHPSRTCVVAFSTTLILLTFSWTSIRHGVCPGTGTPMHVPRGQSPRQSLASCRANLPSHPPYRKPQRRDERNPRKSSFTLVLKGSLPAAHAERIHVLEGCNSPGKVLQLDKEIDRISTAEPWVGKLR